MRQSSADINRTGSIVSTVNDIKRIGIERIVDEESPKGHQKGTSNQKEALQDPNLVGVI